MDSGQWLKRLMCVVSNLSLTGPNYSVGSTRDKNTCNLNKENRAGIRQRSIYGTSFIGGLCHRIRNGLDTFTNVVLP